MQHVKSIFFLTICFCFWSCNKPATLADSDNGKKGHDVKPVPVAVENPVMGEAFEFYITTSTLEPEYRAQIRSKTSGVIQELLVVEGDLVSIGDPLLRLENADQTLALKQAEISFDQAKKEFTRNAKMHAKGILADEVFEQIENNYRKASAELESANLKLSNTEVKSPLEGTLVTRFVDLGAHIDTGTALFDVMDMHPMLVRIHVPATRMKEVHLGQVMELICDSTGGKLTARIHLISPIVDPTTGTIKVTAALDSYPDSVRPGEFVKVHLITQQKNEALLVPGICVFEEKGQKVVFVVQGEIAHRKNVDIGLSSGEKVEILAGVSLEDRVVTKGQRELKEGQKVQILEGPGKDLPGDLTHN